MTDGSYCPGGLDGYANCYSANLLGSVVSFNGTSLTLGPANVPDAVTYSTVPLPAGQFSTMTMLATGVDGNQASQNLRVNYTDGTSTSFTQSFSDWHTPQNYAGESAAATMGYRDTAFGTKDFQAWYLYGYSFALNGAKTVQSVTLPPNSSVVVMAITLTAAAAPPPAGGGGGTPAGAGAVNLSSVFNRWGLVTDGSYCPGGLDGYANCYSANLLGSVVSFNGTSLTLGPANVPDAVTYSTVPLPAGQFSTMTMLATGVNGNQASQNLRVNYTDGTSTSLTQSFSDWHTPQNYAGEGVAATMGYRDTAFGTKDFQAWYLYGYSFALNGAKTVQSVTLPSNPNVVAFAINLTGSGGGSSSFSPTTYSISGTVINSGATVTLSGSSSAVTGTDAYGLFSFSGLQNGSYVVAPSNPGYTFSPATAMISVNNGSTTGVNFTAIAAPVGQFVQPPPVNPPPVTPPPVTPPPVSHSVSLTWNPTTSPNITGYNLYRSNSSGGPYALLTQSPIAAVSYLDSNVTAGLTYFYVATTVQGGSESLYSNQATAVIPTP